MHLPRKVALQLLQILRLARKMNLVLEPRNIFLLFLVRFAVFFLLCASLCSFFLPFVVFRPFCSFFSCVFLFFLFSSFCSFFRCCLAPFILNLFLYPSYPWACAPFTLYKFEHRKASVQITRNAKWWPTGPLPLETLRSQIRSRLCTALGLWRSCSVFLITLKKMAENPTITYDIHSVVQGTC